MVDYVGGVLKVQDGSIYYFKVNTSNWKFKVYMCSLTGKNKTVLTDWVDEIPAEYLE